MTQPPLDQMLSGTWYNALSPALEALRLTARQAVHAHNTMPPTARGGMADDLARLFQQVGADCFIEAPFHCAYGRNIALGDGVYLNAGVTILDSAPVIIGSRSMLGPNVQIYCADHHRDIAKRRAGIERGLPVTLGVDVWVGGGAILMPGVTIGAGVIVGAGAVVTKSVPENARVVGNPARAL